jgi:glycosyltransferase involved in cell wall biosynthesis
VRAAWHLIEDRASAPPGFGRVLSEFRPDVLHTNSLYGLTTDVWAKAKARQVPVVHTLHDYYLTCARSTRFKNDARCRTTCAACSCLTNGRRRASTAVDTVVGVSERILAIHQECGLFNGSTQREIIRNPPPPPRKTVAPVRRDGKIVFGFIGRPSVEKGIFELLSAFRKLPRNAARLVVAGAANKEMQARMTTIAGDSDVEFLGFVRPEAFFEKIDVTIAPSIWDDPCPMIIGESFAYARPVIGAQRGGIPELIADERSGWLYAPATDELGKLLFSIVNDKNSVAAKSEYLYSLPEPRNFDDLVSEYISVYAKVVSEGERHDPWRT